MGPGYWPGKALAGGAAPYLAEQIHRLAPDEASRVMAHAVVAGVLAELQGSSAAAGAATAAIGSSAIAKAMYGTDDFSKLDETQKQMVSALSTLAGGLAGGLVGNNISSAIAGAQSGKNTSENNDMFDLPKGMKDYNQAQGSLMVNTNLVDENGKIMNPMSDEEKVKASQQMPKGDLPEGANITKVIVEGYYDGVLIAGAWYLGPAASADKIVTGGTIAEIANGTYQWFDISSEKNQSLPKNQQKTRDYKGSVSAGVTGMLAPGRSVWQNAGIAVGGTLFTDGPDKGALVGTGAGWVFGTVVGAVAPPVFGPVLGSGSAPAGDIIGAMGGEFISNAVKDEINGTKK